MPWYRDRVLPHLMDRMMRTPDVERLRSRVATGLAGTVVEVGFGSGLNARHYPPGVDRVLAVEPSMVSRHLAEPRVATVAAAVEWVGLDGQRLPLDDDVADAALSTWTLCTIPDPGRALAELRRVLRPGGRLHFVEHGPHPDAGVRRWQHRIEPVQKALAGGCHLTRDSASLLAGAGFEVAEVEHEQVAGLPTHSWCTIGVAVNP